jgi:hypothetical protein
VAFDPDVFAMPAIPVTGNPVGMRMWRLDVDTGNPDIVIAFPAVIAGMPGPVAMLGRGRRDDFVGWRRGANGDMNLSVSDADRQKKRAGYGEELLLHAFVLL